MTLVGAGRRHTAYSTYHFLVCVCVCVDSLSSFVQRRHRLCCQSAVATAAERQAARDSSDGRRLLDPLP